MMQLESEESFCSRALQVPIEPLSWNFLQRYGIELMVRRDDQADAELSGNKSYKLFFNLLAAQAAGVTQLASFGGAWSNHLHALAAAGRRYGFNTIGLVRGERPAVLSATLQDAESNGMFLHFLARDIYRQEKNTLTEYLRSIYGDVYLIPEGGANTAGIRGAQLIGAAIEQHTGQRYHQICLPCATGTTLTGIATGVSADKTVIGFSVLKGNGSLGTDIGSAYRNRMPVGSTAATGKWRLITGFHGGGYGKKLPQNLLHFWRGFELETGLLVDPVYTLKMFWGIACLAQQGYWQRGTRLVAVHTGGLQGRRGFFQQIDW